MGRHGGKADGTVVTLGRLLSLFAVRCETRIGLTQQSSPRYRQASRIIGPGHKRDGTDGRTNGDA